MTPDEIRAIPALILALFLLVGLVWPKSQD